MIDNDTLPLAPQSFFREPTPQLPGNRSRGRRRILVFGGVLALGLGLAAADFAAAAAGMDHWGWGQGARLAMVQHAVARGLDSVGATAEQEAKAHDIVAAKFADLTSGLDQREALRKEALDLLGAPTIDRAAVEKLRSQVVAGFDAKSKLVVGALLDIADVLTPTQRAQLATEIEHHPMHGGPMGAPDGAPDKE